MPRRVAVSSQISKKLRRRARNETVPAAPVSNWAPEIPSVSASATGAPAANANREKVASAHVESVVGVGQKDADAYEKHGRGQGFNHGRGSCFGMALR